MKRRFKFKDEQGNVEIRETEIPNILHLDAQIRFKSQVFRDRTKYCRKQKYKNSDIDS